MSLQILSSTYLTQIQESIRNKMSDEQKRTFDYIMMCYTNYPRFFGVDRLIEVLKHSGLKGRS